MLILSFSSFIISEVPGHLKIDQGYFHRGVGGGGSEDKRNPGWGYPQVHTPRGRGTGEGRISVTLVRITRSTRRRWVREGSGVGSERAEEGKNDKS